MKSDLRFNSVSFSGGWWYNLWSFNCGKKGLRHRITSILFGFIRQCNANWLRIRFRVFILLEMIYGDWNGIVVFLDSCLFYSIHECFRTWSLFSNIYALPSQIGRICAVRQSCTCPSIISEVSLSMII